MDFSSKPPLPGPLFIEDDISFLRKIRNSPIAFSIPMSFAIRDQQALEKIANPTQSFTSIFLNPDSVNSPAELIRNIQLHKKWTPLIFLLNKNSSYSKEIKNFTSLFLIQKPANFADILSVQENAQKNFFSHAKFR